MIFTEYIKMNNYKIEKDVPVPTSTSRHDELLKMEINDSVLFTNKKEFSSARGFLRRHFEIKSKTYVDNIVLQDDKETKIFEGRIWRIK